MFPFFMLGILIISVILTMIGCSTSKSNKSTTMVRTSVSNSMAKANDQSFLPKIQQTKVTSIPQPKLNDKLNPSCSSESGTDNQHPLPKKITSNTATLKKPLGKVPTSKESTNTYRDETHQSKLSASEVNKNDKHKTPEAVVDPDQMEDKQVLKTPATVAKTLDVVPTTKVKMLGELNKAVFKKKAETLKEIEEMDSVHEFDKLKCHHSVDNAKFINTNKHVVVAEDKFKLYTISKDEIIEEQPTQESIK